MQIMPSGAAWTNPAALSQQASGDPKQSAALKSTTPSKDAVTLLEETGKTTDRDANERYDGPQQTEKPSSSSSNGSPPDADSMMSLPANDDQEATTLDLLG